jgi:ferredoxin
MPDGERTIQVRPGEHIWDAALNAGVVLPALCHHGRCLTCAARLVGDGSVDQSDSVSYFPEDRECGFVLPCTGKPLSNLRLRTHQQAELRQHRRKKAFLRHIRDNRQTSGNKPRQLSRV